MKEVIKNEIKRQATKKIIAITVATGGGCLIPVLCVIVVILAIGWVSAASVSSKYQMENIKNQAIEAGQSVRDFFLDLFIKDVSDKNVITDSDLSSMAFDRKSLKTMLELVKEYNNDSCEKKIKVEMPGTFNAGTGDYYYYRVLILRSGNVSKVRSIKTTKAKYTAWMNATDGDSIEGSGKKLSEEPDYEDIIKEASDLEACKDYIVVTDYYYRTEIVEKKRTTTKVEVTLSNKWIREKYPVDWQIVYLLCFYDSYDNGGKSTDYDEDTGKKIRLKKKYIEQVIEDVSSVITSATIVPDVSPDVVYYQLNGKSHRLDAVSYRWGLLAVTQDDISEYGYGIIYPTFTEKVKHNFKTYTATFTNGKIPASCLATVRTLTTYEVYKYDFDSKTVQNKDTVPSSVVTDVSKFEALLEKYGHGRSIEMFLYALAELPGGEEIAEGLRKSIKLSEEEETKDED